MYFMQTLFSYSAPNGRDPTSLWKAPSSNYSQELVSLEIQISSLIIVSKEQITLHKFLSDLETRVCPSSIFTVNAKIQESSIQHRIPMWTVGANRKSGPLLYNLLPTSCMCLPFLHPPHSLYSDNWVAIWKYISLLVPQTLSDENNHSQW